MAAAKQWGAGARAVTLGDHLYDWRATVDGELRGLDLQRAVREEHCTEWDLVHIGLGKDDWRALNLFTLGKAVVPVMLVASDLLFTDVKEGIANFSSALERVYNWYVRETTQTFRMFAASPRAEHARRGEVERAIHCK